MPPPPTITADQHPCVDGSAVHTALVACRAAVALRPAAVCLGQVGQTDRRIAASLNAPSKAGIITRSLGTVHTSAITH